MNKTYSSFNELPLMLNANDIAGILGVSRGFSYNLLNSTGFPVIVIGKRRMVKRDSFLLWLNSQEKEVALHG